MCGESSIREVMAFPKTAQATDLMAGAPSAVDEKQLRELQDRTGRTDQTASTGEPAAVRIGIDLGGTKIAGVVLGDDGRAVWEARVPTPRGDYDATLAAIAALVAEGEAAAGQSCTVGVGMPGAISPATGLVKNANSTWLNGRAFQADLERHWAARFAWRTTRTAWRCRRRRTARRPARGSCSG